MHIVIIPSWYPKDSKDVGGSFFREQAMGLRKRGHKVGVVSPKLTSLKSFSEGRKNLGYRMEDDEGVMTYRFNSFNFTPRLKNLSRLQWEIIGYKLFSLYIKKHGKPDIIHVHSMNPAIFLAYKIFRDFNIPYVITEHSTAFARGLVGDKLKSKLKEPVKKASYKIAVSSEFANLLQTQLDSTVWNYVPNIVSESFLSLNNVLEEKKNYYFLNVCLLEEKKRVDLLIKAFCLLSQDYPDVRLKIGGDGSCKRKLIELVAHLNIEDKVTFMGMLNREQVQYEMSNTDAFALSSEYETFGVVLVEALALGKPVIATRCGGPESIVIDKVGILVDKNNIDALYQGMKSVYESEYDSAAIKAYCKDNFSEPVVLSSLEKIYSQVIKNNK
ncbi:glycosyltransferase [Photobacterium sp. TLY01]|uniref:glycosyltransferase n=1 Tax=Photobacterium sp. TLY01 TaxID=2907534 RepID=UPI001F4780AB|nr:glycosyltransferase [Photobacterium sp. TLY01]UIP27228.1 glycosyltransferase [Photobacterium sp. TLY01]